jgi:hypothetical protein
MVGRLDPPQGATPYTIYVPSHILVNTSPVLQYPKAADVFFAPWLLLFHQVLEDDAPRGVDFD